MNNSDLYMGKYERGIVHTLCDFVDEMSSISIDFHILSDMYLFPVLSSLLGVFPCLAVPPFYVLP